MTPRPSRHPRGNARTVPRERGQTLSSETRDRLFPTPGATEQDHSIRGWQSLAEKRGQELAEARTKLAQYETEQAVRQLADEYPDAAEFVLRERGQLSPSMRDELSIVQRTIESEREANYHVDANNPRRPPAPPPKPLTPDEGLQQIREWRGDL